MTQTRHRLLLSDPILALLAERLAPDFEVLKLWEHPDQAAFAAAAGQGVEAIVHAGDTVIAPALVESLPSLKLIACVSVGYDGVNVPHARSHGVEVTHAQWLNADDVADFAIGLMIAAHRGVVAGDQFLRAGAWFAGDRIRPFGSLTGKTLGIVGLGHIGEQIALRAEPMKMKIRWWGPRPKESRWERAHSVLALAEASDVLMVACRADETNVGLISREVIEAVGKRGLIVNVARGQVIDEPALVEALKAGTLGMAALDVFSREPMPAEPWADVPNTVLTPHLAGSSAETVGRLVGQAMENLRRHFAGEPLLSPVPKEG